MRNEQARERERSKEKEKKNRERERELGNQEILKLNYDFLNTIIQYIFLIYIMN